VEVVYGATMDRSAGGIEHWARVPVGRVIGWRGAGAAWRSECLLGAESGRR
jgi:hypothetical protein